jgi:OPA family glycerol-3-phosphate transporter-like MFS transporter
MGDAGVQQTQREWRRRILVSTWLAYAGLYFCRKPFYVAKGTLVDELGFTVGELGEIGTAYLVAYTIGQFASAWLGQRRGARVLLLVGIGTSILCNVAFGFTNSYWPLFAFMSLNGLAQATGWPAVVGTLGRWTRRSERGTVMGLWGTCYQLGGVAASMWAAFWLARLGIRGAFLMASAVLFGCWIAVALWQRNRPEDVGLPPLEPSEEGEDADDAPSPWTRALITNLLLLGVFYFGIKFIRYAIWSWTPFLLEKNFGLAVDDAGYLSTVFDLAGFAGVVVAGIVSDRFFRGKRTPPSFLMVLGMMGGCAALHFVGGSSLLLFGCCLGVIGFMLYGPDSLLAGAGAVEVGSPRLAVATAGIINGMGSIGAVVQELVVSNLLDADGGDTGPIFAVLWGASLLSVAALSVILLRNRKGQAHL